jgi:hypothetical protein
MEHKELEKVKYHVLFYKRYEYAELQEKLTEKRELTTDAYIDLLLEFAVAAVSIDTLTDNQCTIFKVDFRRETSEWHYRNIEIIPSLLIPVHAKMLLNRLCRNPDWKKEQETACRVAEQVRNIPEQASTSDTVDTELLTALTRKFETQRQQESLPRKSETVETSDPSENFDIEKTKYGYSIAELHEISIRDYNSKGWAKLARMVLEYQVQRKWIVSFSKNDVDSEARNIKNRVESYRAKKQTS